MYSTENTKAIPNDEAPPDKTEVSSKTVVKYVEPKLNISNNYVQLAEKTNLNLPPSNWLKEFLPGSFTPQLQRNDPINYASLFMAGRYPEMFTEVDVVSASKHIKKLLKTPFNSNTSYSMSVHRIGNSLFLNDLDIPSLLKSNQFKDEKLGWLLDLYCSANSFSNDSEIHPKKKNKELSQQQMIESKFMYYSIGNETADEKQNEDTKEFRRSNSICGPDAVEQPSNEASNAIPSLNLRTFQRSNSLCGPKVDQPASIVSSPGASPTALQDSIPPPPFPNDFPAGSFFMRDVLWTFEDITMLVGSDLPIFGEGRYPAVSLRLKDASKPINVLTGMDYWLDNLMCNVPELMMCYHLNGIVQKYEKIKTAELPFMEGSQFSPRIIKDVAQNILSFLKSNCTKEGHTYWLFKSSKEDVVKLYDLTSIAQENESPDPFGSSVGFLLYQIAINMYTTLERTDHNILKMVALLENCIKIFHKERCNELLAMANFLLSDLYAQSLTTTTSTIDTSNLTDNDYSNDSSYATDDESVDSNDSIPLQSSIDVKTLFEEVSIKRSYEKYEYINKNLDEEQKCKNSIQAVTKVLLLLFDMKNTGASNQIIPFTRKINESLLALPELDSSNRAIVKPFNKQAMKSRLLCIIAKCYLTMVRISLSKEKFGRTLRFLNITFKALMNLKEKYLSAQALMYYGDVITMLASSRNLNIDVEKEEYMNFNNEDKDLLMFLENKNAKDNNEFFCNIDTGNLVETFDNCYEELLLLATDVYQESYNNLDGENTESDKSQAVVDITRRHANICNELGVLYMNKAASTGTASRFGVPSDSEIKLWKISYSHFEKGIKAFDLINDRANVALLYSNTGKLMRLCAQVYGNSTKSSADGERGQFTQQEETYFNKAFEFYNKGLASLSSGEVSPQIKNTLLMELAGAHLSMATLMQDNAPLQSKAEEKVVKQVSSSLMKSLHYVESISNVEAKGEHHIQKQIATVHQKLGSLYHHVLRNQISDSGKKNYRSLAELHYFKAYNHCNPKLNPINFVQIIMEHLALYDYLLAQNQSSKSLKSKHRLLFEDEIAIREAVSELCNRVDRERLGAGEKDKATRLMTWLYGQLNRTLKETIKYMSGKTVKSFNHLDIGNVKKMFEAVIRGTLPNDLKGKTNGIKTLLVLLNKLYKKDVKS